MTRFIALVSGKGGTGKTTTTLNLGHSLTKLGKKTILVDANLTTPNLAIQLGFMNPEGTINKFIRKEKNLSEVTYLHESGISLIPASPSFAEFQKTDPSKLSELFEHLENMADFVLIDSPSGLGYEVSQVLKNCDEALIIVNPTLSSMMDSLKTIQLAKSHDNIISGLVFNLSNKGKYELKKEDIENLLGYPIVGEIRTDKKIRKALNKQAPLTYLYPFSRSARQYKKVAEHLCLEPKVELHD